VHSKAQQEQAHRTGVEGFDTAVLNTRDVLLRELHRVRDNQSKLLKSQENIEADFKALMSGQLPLKVVTPGRYIPPVTSYAVIGTVADQVSLLLLFKQRLTILFYLQASASSPSSFLAGATEPSNMPLLASAMQPSNTPAQAISQPSPSPPIYELFAARTVRDAWREWKEGIGGRPALEQLENNWGSALRPTRKLQIAFCRRKVVLDEVLRLVHSGFPTPEQAVTELDARRGKLSLYSLCERLLDERKERGESKRQRRQGQGNEVQLKKQRRA
jgi:hypothetical protein